VEGPAFLRDRGPGLLLFGGKGGVGKTTCAAAAALDLAGRLPSVLLASTDPAHSLADSLAGLSPPSNLDLIEIDAQERLTAFRERHGQKFEEMARRGTFLDDEDIRRLLDLSFPGLDEVMAFLEVSRWAEGGRYDRILVDTAPTGHTLRLLTMPEFWRRWLQTLDALLAKHRYMKRLYSGFYRRDELDAFLEELAASERRMEGLLQDPARCCFVPVTLAETLSLHETTALVGELERLRVPVGEVVVNRLYPASAAEQCPACAEGRDGQMRRLRDLSGPLARYPLWGVPLHAQEVRGEGPLRAFWGGVERMDTPLPSPDFGFRISDFGMEALQSAIRNPQSAIQKANRTPLVEGPAGLPSPETRLLFLGGKGGVGKTTLACATAIRLSLAGRSVLLASTDPAHSLSACLGARVGADPTPVLPGLWAVEIDAGGAFEALKAAYAEELNRFLDSISPNLDLTFDRQVMERIMDLSPPGLDEVMALSRLMGFLAEDRHDCFVLDSAPTGHLIRLLELPGLIDRWLRVVFDLLLKYREVLRAPDLSRRLVEVSKGLKRLRVLLGDRTRSALYAVSILTEMALEETRDLVAACDRVGVGAPALFLNLATPASECPLCSEARRVESRVRRRYREAFPGRPQTLVFRGREPVGVEALERLGRALYR